MTTRHCFRFYSEYDIKGIVKFLDKMAAKGWLLEKKSGVFYSFVKTDKPFVKYDITYFTDGIKENNYLPFGSDRYIGLANAAGWQLLTNDHKMQIFISEMPDSTTLETQAHIKVDVIHKSFVSQWLFLYLLMIFNGFIRLLHRDFEFADNMLILFAVMTFWDLCCYFAWYFKAKKAANDGWYYETRTPFVRMYVDPVITLIMLIWLLKDMGIKAAVFLTVIGVFYFTTQE